jgi:class 3 adenylate cyclase
VGAVTGSEQSDDRRASAPRAAPAPPPGLLNRRDPLGARGARTGRLSLHFADADLERGFLRTFRGANLPHVRSAFSMGIVLTITFGAVDVWLVGHHVGPALVVRGVLVLLLAAALWATYRPWFPEVDRTVPIVAPVVAALAFDLMTIVSPMPPGYAAFASMISIVFLGTLARGTVGLAGVGAAVITAGFLTSAISNGDAAKIVVYQTAFVAAFLFPALGASLSFERLRRREFLSALELAGSRARTDDLLRNILPDEIADQLRANPGTIATAADDVSVIFADIADFTPLAATLPPAELVTLLDRLFRDFDALCDVHEVEKIKTIGDAYMGVAGLPTPVADHAASAAEMGLDMLDAAARFEGWPGRLELRVGISSGPVVAGVIGERKFSYDLWGDTVNTASRMESQGAPGEIQVSERTWALLRGRYRFGPVHHTAIKGKGTLDTYRLIARGGRGAAP